MEINIARPNLYPRTCPNCPVVDEIIKSLKAGMEKDEKDFGQASTNSAIKIKCFDLKPGRYYTISIEASAKLKFEDKEVNTTAPKLQAICPGLEASLPEGVRRTDLETD